jgi:hypothetical protein
MLDRLFSHLLGGLRVAALARSRTWPGKEYQSGQAWAPVRRRSRRSTVVERRASPDVWMSTIVTRGGSSARELPYQQRWMEHQVDVR